MTFLNPAILFGLLAASIPLLIHLLNLKKLSKVEFSTLAFLKELQKTKIKRIKIKQWILLAVRMIAVALIVLAFSRPTLKSISFGDKTSAAKTTAVIIIDNSISMSVITEKGSYFNQSKEILKELLADFNPGDGVYFIKTSDLFFQNKFEPVNLASAEKIVESMNLSNASGKIETALGHAFNILAGSKNFNKEIYLFSDIQKSMLSESSTKKGLFNFDMPESIRIYNFKFGDKDITNFSLTDLTVNNQIFELGRPVTFTSTIQNFSNRSIKSQVVSLFVNGIRKAQQSVDLGQHESRQLSFETTLDKAGLIEIFAEIDDDEIPLDNKRYLSTFIPEKISLLICSDKNSDAVFVQTALERALAGNIIVDFKKPEQVSYASAEMYDVIILIGGEDKIKLSELEKCLQEGVNFIFCPGENSSIDGLSGLFSRLGLEKPIDIIGSLDSENLNNGFDIIDFKHPIFNDLFEKDIRPEIESPNILKFVKTNPRAGQTIISLLDGSTFLTEHKIGKGKFFFFSVAPVLSWSNFPVKGLFAPLITKSIFYLSSKINEVKTLTAGEKILINSTKAPLPQIKVIMPNKNEDFINLESLNKKYFEYCNTTSAGIYKFYSGEKLIDYASVNLDPAESSFEYISDNEFKNYLSDKNLTGSNFIIDPDDDYETIIYQSRFGTELWKYFLLAAFLLLVFEMLIARNTKKEIVSLNKLNT